MTKPQLACCEFHDREPELYPRCAPDDQGGYCCDDCPTLARDRATAVNERPCGCRTEEGVFMPCADHVTAGEVG